MELAIYKNKEFGEVRAIEIDGTAWFVGKDVADALGYADTADAIKKHVDEEDKKLVKVGEIPTLKVSNYGAYLINESGMYSLTISSKLEGAKKFRRWITAEVLPSIRKNGGYIAGQEQMTPEQMIEQALVLAHNLVKEKEKQLEQKKAQIEQMQPKADFFDAVTDSKTAISIGEVAKILDMGIGRNKLFEILRDEGILMSDNQPYQKYVDAGYFRVIEQKYVDGCGETRINIKTLVFQSGVNYIRRRIEKRVAPKCQGQA